MILRQYVSDGVTNVLAIIFCILAMISFGYAEYFDRLFIVFLVGILLLNFTNANAVSVVAIFLFERLIEEGIFFSSTLYLAKPIVYLGAVLIVRQLWYDSVVKYFVAPTLVACIACEIYWYASQYSAPRMHSYIAMLCLNVITRHLLFLRVPIFSKLFDVSRIKLDFVEPLKQVNLDWQLYRLSMVNCLVVVAMIGEYLIRHLTGIKVLVVYDVYPYLMQTIAILTLFFITLFIVKSVYKIDA